MPSQAVHNLSSLRSHGKRNSLDDAIFAVVPIVSKTAGGKIGMKQDVTLSLDKQLHDKIRVIAEQRSLTIDCLVENELMRLAADSDHYEKSRMQALHDLREGFHLGGDADTGWEFRDAGENVC